MSNFEERARVAEDVYTVLFNNTESFEDDNIGADLAYLLGAILRNTWCTWKPNRPILSLLRRLYPENAPVWTYVKTDS